MPMQKIKQDSVSVYVRCNGTIHRPLVAELVLNGRLTYRETGAGAVIDGNLRRISGMSRWIEGDEVLVKNINYTPNSNVGGELWTTHGPDYYYYEGSKRVKVATDEAYYHGQEYADTVDRKGKTL